MEYSADLFTSKKTPSPDTRYYYEITGAFYSVFSNGEDDFHMAIEDKASLEERIHFYHLYLSKEQYPIYSKKYGLVKDINIPSEILQQVLGLPIEVMSKKNPHGDGYIMLSGEEILSRIHFEEGLFRGYPKMNVTAMVLNSNHPSVIGAINHLIANGFYVLNPERIFDVDQLNEGDYYPLHIDVEKIPARLLREKETSHKLIMDFVSDPFLITKEVYYQYFRPLDEMDLTKMASLAFARKIDKKMPKGEKAMRLALKRYFLSMIRTLLNEFYMKHYHQRGLFGFSVLDHDFEGVNFPHRMIYQGQHYDMYANRYRTFELHDDQVYQSYVPTDYVLDKDDRKKILHAYDVVHHYFVTHKEYAFIPSVFLRMLGLPYPAFELTKYFDFEYGDKDAFIQKLTFEDNVDYKKNGLILTLLLDNGNQLSMKYWPSNLSYYLKYMERIGFYVSDIYAFSSTVMPNFLLHSTCTNKKLQSILSGDYEAYHEALFAIADKVSQLGNTTGQFDQLKTLVVRDNQSGVLVSVKRFFDLLLSGYSADEAKRILEQERPEVDVITIRILINIAMLFFFEKTSENHLNAMAYSSRERVFENLNRGEHFFDPYLDYPQVYKGRNFLAYSKDEKDFYFDSQDQEAMKNLLEIFDKYFLYKYMFPYTLQVFGRELHYVYDYVGKNIDFVRLKFLGLPEVVSRQIDLKKDICSQLKFKDGISMFSKENHQKLLAKDYSLHYPYIFREVAKKGFYLNGRLDYPTTLYCIDRNRLDERIRYYLSRDFIRIQLQGLSYNEKLSEIGDEIQYMSDKYFEDTYLRYLYRKDTFVIVDENEEGLSEAAIKYGGKLMHALYQCTYHDLFKNENYHHYLGYYQDGDLYVAPGNSFYAYSTNPSLSSFGLPEEDVDSLLEVYQVLMKNFAFLKNKIIKAKIITYHLGLPAILQERIYHQILDNDFVLKKDDIPSGPWHIDESRLFSYHDICRMYKPVFSDVFYSTQLYHEALKEGMFVYPDTQILDPKILQPETMSKEFVATSEKIAASFLAIMDKQSGVIKDMVHPNATTFYYLVKDFIQAYDEITDLSPEFLFYVQEAFIYGYHKDENFLSTAINLLQNGHAKDYIKYLKEIYREFNLKEFKTRFPKDSVFQFFTFFLVYLEQQALYRISKNLRMR